MDLKKIILYNLPIIVILVTAAILRFWRIESLTTFGGDQGYDFLIVKRMIVDGKLTLLGPKIGPYNQLGNLYLGPIYYYLLIPSLLIFHLDPIGPAIFTVILSLTTIFLIYLICLKFISRETALLAGSMYAFNSFLISQSRASSNPHLIPFFSSIFILSIFQTIIPNEKTPAFMPKMKRILSEKKRTTAFRPWESIGKSAKNLWPFFAGFSLGIMFQLHYIAASLIFPTVGVYLLSRNFKKVIICTVAFTLAILPQIVFELRHKFFITNQIIIQFKAGHILQIQSLIANLTSTLQDISKLFITTDKPILIIISITILVLFLIFARSSKIFFVFYFLALLVVFNLTSALFYPSPINAHYFASIYPPLIIIIAAVFIWMINLVRTPVFVTICILVLLQIFTINLLNLDLSKKEGYTMPAGWNLLGIKKASRLIAQDVPTGVNFNVAATLDGDTRARPYRYLLEVMGKIPLDVEKYPESQIIYLISKDEENKIKDYTVWEVSSFRPFEIIQKWDIQNGINLYKLVKPKKI